MFVICCSINVFGQFILAGTHGTADYYYDLLPDKKLQSTPTPNYSVDTFLIDINNDNINDFKLTAADDNGGNWYHYVFCAITPLNNNRIAIDGYDSCFANVPPQSFLYRSPMAKAFALNDSINKNNIWIDSMAYLSFNNWSANYPNTYGYDCNGETFFSDSKYLGLSVILPNDTLFSWIKIREVSNDSLTIEEFASNLFSTKIATFQNKFPIEIYPNPTTGIFTLRNDGLPIKMFELNICNTLAEKIYSKKIYAPEVKIDLQDKPKGIYFIKIVSEYESVTRKIIIE